MNKSTVGDYHTPFVSYKMYQIISINLIAIIPNIYFLFRSITYGGFNQRKLFKYMTMIMSIEYICSCLLHLIYYEYLLTYRLMNLLRQT